MLLLSAAPATCDGLQSWARAGCGRRRVAKAVVVRHAPFSPRRQALPPAALLALRPHLCCSQRHARACTAAHRISEGRRRGDWRGVPLAPEVALHHALEPGDRPRSGTPRALVAWPPSHGTSERVPCRVCYGITRKGNDRKPSRAKLRHGVEHVVLPCDSCHEFADDVRPDWPPARSCVELVHDCMGLGSASPPGRPVPSRCEKPRKKCSHVASPGCPSLDGFSRGEARESGSSAERRRFRELVSRRPRGCHSRIALKIALLGCIPICMVRLVSTPPRGHAPQPQPSRLSGKSNLLLSRHA